MHKPYRELAERVQLAVAPLADPKRFVDLIGEIDDLDPLRVPALKAMKRLPAPPLRLLFVREGNVLVLSAENLTRKRKAQKLTQCAHLDYPAWVFDPHAPSELEPAVRLDILEMMKESFALLGTRIALYFPVSFGQELIIDLNPLPHYRIEDLH